MWKRGGLCLVGGIAFALIVRRAGAIGIGFALVSLFFIWAVFRLQMARRSLAGPYLRVWAVGWSRAPDGCNYALFDPDDTSHERPEWVLRLPIVRPVQSAAATLCGSPRPGAVLDSHALIDLDGNLIAAGRVVTADVGQKRWDRRHKPKSRWVAGPAPKPPSE
jgi:hypothetical protein